MTSFEDSLGGSADYTYYPDGLRRSKTTGGNTYQYYYNGDYVINETKNGSEFATNVFGVDGPISRKFNNYENYYYKNVHGDVIFAFTNGKWRSAEYSYGAYGNEGVSYDAFSDPNPIRYAGEYFDTESGMTYLRARYYDPIQRRFITEDPIKDGMNWYAYCNNNPVMFVDPSGLRTYILNGIDNSKTEGSPENIENFGQTLEDKGVKDVRTIGVYNGTNKLTGLGQLAMEVVNVGQYTDSVAQQILNELIDDPLEEGEELNIIGYSGGGQIALNVAEKLEGKTTIDNTVLIGAPVSEVTLNNTGEVTSLWAAYDMFSWNVAWGDVNLEFAGWFRHSGYFSDENIDNTADIVDKYID